MVHQYDLSAILHGQLRSLPLTLQHNILIWNMGRNQEKNWCIPIYIQVLTYSWKANVPPQLVIWGILYLETEGLFQVFSFFEPDSWDQKPFQNLSPPFNLHD